MWYIQRQIKVKYTKHTLITKLSEAVLKITKLCFPITKRQ